MMCMRLIRSATSIKNRNELLARCAARFINSISNRSGNAKRIVSINARKDTELEEDELDKPYQYSTSKAAKVRVMKTRLPGSEAAMNCEGLVVSFCLSIFLGYFCILREPNDIDLMLDVPVDFLNQNRNTLEQNIKE